MTERSVFSVAKQVLGVGRLEGTGLLQKVKVGKEVSAQNVEDGLTQGGVQGPAPAPPCGSSAVLSHDCLTQVTRLPLPRPCQLQATEKKP